MRSVFISILAVLATTAMQAQTVFDVLHSFSGGDGQTPFRGKPAISGSTLYGATFEGTGSAANGVLYKVDTDGTGFSVLHEFAGSPDDGAEPWSSPIYNNGRLYGSTAYGGFNDVGTVYRHYTDGSGHTILHYFDGPDGQFPMAPPVLDGTTLYGTTWSGGFNTVGVIYKIEDITGPSPVFTKIYDFASATGENPYGGVIVDGSYLYGMTEDGGGGSGYGVIYRIGTDGSAYTVLHNFDEADGKDPYGELIIDGATLYGMTSAGGGGGAFGVAFKIDTDGGNYSVLHRFAGAPDDGKTPYGSLALDNGFLYGMTQEGGANNLGAVFRMRTDGSDFTLLHSFAGDPADGAWPEGTPVIVGDRYYGFSDDGGTNDLGAVFSPSRGFRGWWR